jgi:hypothetical protein
MTRNPYSDPAYRQHADQHLRDRAARYRAVEDAVVQAKRGKPQRLLDLLPADVDEAIEHHDLLPQHKKRGKPFTVLGQAEQDIRRMLKLRRRARGGTVRYGTIPLLARRKVLALVKRSLVSAVLPLVSAVLAQDMEVVLLPDPDDIDEYSTNKQIKTQIEKQIETQIEMQIEMLIERLKK